MARPSTLKNLNFLYWDTILVSTVHKAHTVFINMTIDYNFEASRLDFVLFHKRNARMLLQSPSSPSQ